MTKLTGEIRDRKTGEIVEARVQIIGPTGHHMAPINAMWKVGPGEPFFYSNGQFSVDLPKGYSQILVERGTEYTPWRKTIEISSRGTGEGNNTTLDIELDRWNHLGDIGWHPGNTHIHYDEKETDPDRRLKYDSRVEDLRMTAVSVLKRWDLDYATNKYPPGVLNEYTDTHHYVQSGEETRHNQDPSDPFTIGYGHVMLLNIRNIVEPLSRGLLVDPFSPDYPPLSYACDKAINEGGLVIWCHNGQGMEAPVSAALGKVHAINLFDPYWTDIEYDIWYHMLNCGIKMPASTGSDWFVSSANRVYALGEKDFSYENWMNAVKEGRTFITNGPALLLAVNGLGPGSTIEVNAGDTIPVRIDWKSHYQVDRVELVFNGAVIASNSPSHNSSEGHFEKDVEIPFDGWLAARISGGKRDSFNQPIWAHTSPVYISGTNIRSETVKRSSGFFVDRIDEALDWVKKKGKFYTDVQRKEVLDIHRAGQDFFIKLLH